MKIIMSKKKPYLCQIYLITPPQIDDLASFSELLEQVLSSAPVGCLQLRLKDTPRERVVEVAQALLPITQANDTALIINDDPEIAATLGAIGKTAPTAALEALGLVGINKLCLSFQSCNCLYYLGLKH